MDSMKSKENQLSGKLSAEESGNLLRFFEIPPRMSENSREFPWISGKSQENLKNSEEGFSVIFLKEIASKSPLKPDFRRLRRKKGEKISFLGTRENDQKSLFSTVE